MRATGWRSATASRLELEAGERNKDVMQITQNCCVNKKNMIKDDAAGLIIQLIVCQFFYSPLHIAVDSFYFPHKVQYPAVAAVSLAASLRASAAGFNWHE